MHVFFTDSHGTPPAAAIEKIGGKTTMSILDETAMFCEAKLGKLTASAGNVWSFFGDPYGNLNRRVR